MAKRRSESKATTQKTTPADTASNAPETMSADDFPIVGIGASAGGLEVFAQFFSKMPEDTGMAFVLVRRLDPTRVSTMPDLLKRYTKMSSWKRNKM